MRYATIALWLLLYSVNPAFAQISINFGVPGVNIGINLPVYPELQRVPGYPVYYAPGMNSNYFFYDGLYWVYEGDRWYSSAWYNGPWGMVDPMDVPLYVLRVPVRYYRHPPTYFHGWRAQDPPRWGEHWGPSWEEKRSGWDHWNHGSVPAAAPLPTYQRQYSGNRYPQLSQQATIQTQHYRYQPKDPVTQQHFQQFREQSSHAQPAPAAQQQRAPTTQPQHAQRQPQQSSSPQQAQVHQQQSAKPQPQQAQHQQVQHQQAQEKAPQAKGQNKEQGNKEKENKEK
ncbi:MAG TPA: hypothetical protein VLT89_04450 [Usitatibacter sp.]|nr:hypothetical protein [Usitatibacter sp.]